MARLQAENRLMRDKTHPEKASIIKIKEQYHESLRTFKQTVYEDVSREFEKFEETIKLLNSKIDLLEQRTERISSDRFQAKSPEKRLSRSSKSYEYDTPNRETTKKKEGSEPRLLAETKPREAQSEVGDPELFRLQAELDTQRRQRGELSEKYNELNADYNTLKQEHTSALTDIQKYLGEVKRLREALDISNIERTRHLLEKDRALKEKETVEVTHSEEITRVRRASMTDTEKLREKYESELEQLKTMTEDQVSRLVDTYNQEIAVLR